MKRLLHFLKNSKDKIAIVASALGILFYLFLLFIQSKIWNETPISPLSDFLNKDTSSNGSLQYGHYLILLYFCLLIAIWSNHFIRQQWLKNTAIIIASIVLSANVLIYWVGENLTGYAQTIFFDYIEIPSLVILLLLFTIVAYRSREQNDSNWMKYNYLAPLLLTVILTALFENISLAAITSLLICVLILSWNNQETEKINSKSKWYSTAIKGIAIVLIGFSFLMYFLITYKPTNVTGENTAIKKLDSIKDSGLELYIFNTGFNRMAKALSPTYQKWRPCPVYLIKHPKFGYVLFDSGISKKVAVEGQIGLGFPMSFLFESKSRVEMLSFNQIKKMGINPDNIKYLAISHLHDDHIGAVDAFKNAQLILNSESKPPVGSLPEFKAAAAFKESNSPLGKTYDLFGDKTVQLIEKPGHTDSDLMLLVALDQGTVLLTGDAVVHYDWLKSNDVERLPTQPEKAAQNRNNIRNLMTKMPELLVFPGHDMPIIPKSRKDIFIVNSSFFNVGYLNIKQ